MSAYDPAPSWESLAVKPAAADPDATATRLHALVAIAKVVASAEAFEDVLRLTAGEARAALGAASLSLSVWERDRGWLRVLLNVGDLADSEHPDGADEVYTVTDYACIEALLEAQPYVQRVGADPSTPGYDGAVVALLGDLGKGSCMGVPVILEGRVWGELFATRYPGDRPYGPEDLDFALAVAGQIAAGAAQVQHLERVARLAYTDQLTGLANRRAIDDRLDSAITHHRELGTTVSLVIADVNGLKRINDDRGHEAGDRALVHFAGLLSASAGLIPGSLAGRLSGDEFCIVIEGAAADHAVWVAEDLCRRAAAGLDEGVACGVASTGDPVGLIDTPARLFRLADAAQTRAKRSRSRGPVIAGRGLPRDATVRLADVRRSPTDDRRRVRSRGSIDTVRILDDVVATLDQSAAHDIRGRLEVVADAVARLVDAASWWVSYVAPGSTSLASVGFSAIRVSPGQPEGADALDSAAGQAYDLSEYAQTAHAVDGGSVVVLADDPTADAAELAVLAASGWTANLMAGARDHDDGGWLVEIFTDEISSPVVDLAPTLRALVALALVQR
jgi:diguanylate cyclase (GGDEF)-like protein